MEHKIYYHDTDSGGVVYYANYLKYLEEARTEFFEARGVPVPAFLARGFLFAVRSCNVVYKAPARYGDVICSDAVISRQTAAQIMFKQRVWDKATDKTLVEAEVALVCLNRDFKPEPLPADVRERVA
ncbi:MAG: YbgC/FadM family acyl-CoA thioesterase [Candidatus Omnitrophica bacterium]|nr:YbgC/FadM family acyl-CoA thioesterase [Candidatus Omnitrophota bacterium]